MCTGQWHNSGLLPAGRKQRKEWHCWWWWWWLVMNKMKMNNFSCILILTCPPLANTTGYWNEIALLVEMTLAMTMMTALQCSGLISQHNLMALMRASTRHCLPLMVVMIRIRIIRIRIVIMIITRKRRWVINTMVLGWKGQLPFNPTPLLSFSTWTPFLLILFLPTFTFSLRSFPPPLLFLPILFSSSFSPHVFTPLPQSPPGHDTPAGQPPPSQWWWLLSIVLVSGFN